MVAYVRDRICETSTTTGVGNLTLAGAVTGFQGVLGNVTGGLDFYYLIEAVDADGVPSGQWETGIGTCPTTTTMQRLAPLDGSDGLVTAVSFSAGTKRVHVTAPGYQLGWIGAVAYLGANLTTQNYTTSTAISWSGTNPDIDAIRGVTSPGTGLGFYDGGNPSRITVPSVGYDTALINVTAQVSLSNINVADWVELKIRMNGTDVLGRQTFYVPTTTPAFQVSLAQPVSAGSLDYFQLMVQVGADTSISVLSADTYLQLEVLQ